MSIFSWFKKRKISPDSWPLASEEKFVEAWKHLVVGDEKSWVLFKHGTCVILTDPERELDKHAIRLIQQYGPVHPGGPAGDFGTMSVTDYQGWAVTGQHQDILTYVSPDEVPKDHDTDFEVGFYGRIKRDKDAKELAIIHIEDRRNTLVE